MRTMERRLRNVSDMVRALAILADNPHSMADTERISGISNGSCSKNREARHATARDIADYDPIIILRMAGSYVPGPSRRSTAMGCSAYVLGWEWII